MGPERAAIEAYPHPNGRLPSSGMGSSEHAIVVNGERTHARAPLVGKPEPTLRPEYEGAAGREIIGDRACDRELGRILHRAEERDRQMKPRAEGDSRRIAAEWLERGAHRVEELLS